MKGKNSGLKSIGNQFFFTGPTLIFFSITLLIPFLYGLFLSFTNMTSPISPMEFAGLDSYTAAFQDKKFWSAMWLTIKYVAATIILVNAFGFTLAYLVTSGMKGQNFFRAAFFTPNLIGGLVLGYIWQFIFVQSMPQIGEKLGFEILRLGWLGDEQLAFWAVVIVTIWQSSGYLMIIFIAGIVSVPRDIIEASTIDGATTMRRLFRIVLPMMVPSFVVTVFLTLKNSFMVYDLNLSLTNGGPFESTKMVSMHVVQKGLIESNYSVGQAQAIVLFVIVAVITGLQVYFSKKLEVEA
ncbi:carbohydrate ABC transporter permease [Paenibacillus endoradicis]|uniref:carbohydrate ABC transporter permease n=1 Tax=Paenibacillus endoradicis TaxID=2972487 RepID=UPI002159B3DF|nr:sugar ABC transporter permease [Paenibacillus endoradicis]MCR8660189.1 sugar ABC transporter permease [Paenibacillus endoradicis]